MMAVFLSTATLTANEYLGLLYPVLGGLAECGMSPVKEKVEFS